MQRICAGSVSTHALRGESDGALQKPHTRTADFNPRPPRGGRQCDNHAPEAPETISIHALRGESDDGLQRSRPPTGYFNPRPPRGGRRGACAASARGGLFQSTPSARRATRRLTSWGGVLKISIHALREEDDGLYRHGQNRAIRNFNPRPPRGGRHYDWIVVQQGNPFQSTPSARRATIPRRKPAQAARNFNPRPPRGGRHSYKDSSIHTYLFQSTPSARRATKPYNPLSVSLKISIHALREEGDHRMRLGA